MSLTLHTSHGDLKCKVYCDKVPKTAKNFIALAAKGYFNDTLFHRNIKGFIIQGGDPTGTGKGGASIYGKHFEDEIVPELIHNGRGILSMANSGPNSNGSQFFITYNAFDHLDGKNTIFGKISEGYETLDKLEKEPVGKANRPLNQVKIISVTIHENPIAEKEYLEQVKKNEENSPLETIIDRLQKYQAQKQIAPMLMTITGIPGAGKSSISKKLVESLKERGIRAQHISMDGFHFYKAELKQFKNPDFVVYRRGAPYTFNSEKLFNKLKELKQGKNKEIKFPDFQHSQGDPVEDAITLNLQELDLVILEGLYLLFNGEYSEAIEQKTQDFYRESQTQEYWKEIRELSDFKVYVEGDIDKCMNALRERNKCIPGYSAEEIAERVEKSDRKNAELVVLTKGEADLVIQNEFYE